jgi:tripartite ATP-independent transporter DctP family solute receptor
MVRRDIGRRGLLGRSAALAGGMLAAPAIIGHARAQGRSLKMTLADTVANPVYDVCKKFAADVKERTKGALDIQVYGAGQLGSQVNALTGLQTGIIDFVAHTTGYIETIFPRTAVLDLPFVFRDAASAERVLDGPVGEELFKPFPDRGVYGLCWGHWGWRPVSATLPKPLVEPADMSGLKIRIQPGAIYAETYKQVGAIPVAIDISEVYVAMSQGAVQAIETPMISMVANKMQEIVKVVNETNFVYNAGALMVSKRRFDAFPADQQQAVRDAAKAMSAYWRTDVAAATDKAAATMKAAGVTIAKVDVDAYAKATKPIYDKFRPIIGEELVDEVLKQTGGA